MCSPKDWCFAFVYIYICLFVIRPVGNEWWSHLQEKTQAYGWKRLDVVVVQDPDFWGPITILVPERNCSGIDQRAMEFANRTQLEQFLELEASFLGFPKLPLGMTRYDFVDLVQLHSCLDTQPWLKAVTELQYFGDSMETALPSYANVKGLQTTRWNFFYFLSVTLVLPFPFQSQYNVSLLSMLLGKLRVYTLQLSIVALWITFWDQNHYVMSYLPGMAYLLFALWLACEWYFNGPCANPLPDGHERRGVPRILCCVLIPLVFIPVYIVSPIYEFNFIYKAVFYPKSLHNFEVEVTASWPSLLGSVSKCLFGFNIADVILDFGAACVAGAREEGNDFHVLEDGSSSVCPTVVAVA